MDKEKDLNNINDINKKEDFDKNFFTGVLQESFDFYEQNEKENTKIIQVQRI